MRDPAQPPRSRASVWPAGFLAAAAVLLALAGCGSSSNTTSSSAPASTPAQPSSTSSAPTKATALSLEANKEGQLKYTTASLRAPAGNVTIKFTNMAPLEHNVTLASAAGTVVGATPTFQGATKTLTVTLKPGVYKFYCSVPGHRQAGMEGTLVVGGSSGAAGASSSTSTSSGHSPY